MTLQFDIETETRVEKPSKIILKNNRLNVRSAAGPVILRDETVFSMQLMRGTLSEQSSTVFFPLDSSLRRWREERWADEGLR